LYDNEAGTRFGISNYSTEYSSTGFKNENQTPINSTSWNRTGTNVLLANQGDNVGIGNSSPATKLHVEGLLTVTEISLTPGEKLCIDNGVLSVCMSSSKFKENIIEYRNSTAILTQFNLTKFKWKGRDESSYGLIAEDVEIIDPLLIEKYKGTTIGIDYDQIVALLVATVQELKEEIKYLNETKVDK